MERIFLVIAALAVLGALWNGWRTQRILDQLEEMLEEAVQGRFSERRFDESRLSRAETQLAHYLSASALSTQNLAEEKQAIQSLVADISHQTKTPLANILLYIQLLEEQPLTEEGRGCTAELESQAKKLQSLLDALVKTSRLEAGMLTLHPERRPLRPMLEEAVHQLAPRAAEKALTLTLAPTEAPAVFDPKWTAEAVCNLLDNAVKYTPAGGTVTVEVIPYQMFCRVNVTDNGPGIPEAERAKVFQRFYRSPAAYETEGVGIGLYLARQIAEGQGGYIKVSSRPGRGSCFSLYLPRS